MARKPMVTRTITTTKCTVLCMNVVSCEPFNKVVTLPRTYATEEKLTKKLRELIDTKDEKFVAITSAEEVETLYGMPEQKFIDNAEILDPETRKALDNTDEATDEE